MTYFQDKDTTLEADIVRPQDDKTYPIVFMVHGGSWGGRHRGDMSKIAELVASHGFVVMNLSYRFAPAHRYPAQIEDVNHAVEWMKVNASKYHGDVSRMAGWGYSAGGHIITQWALLESEKLKAPVLKAIVAGGAPFDLSWYPQSPIITHLLDGYLPGRRKEYKEASAITHIGPWAPEMYFYHGKTDTLVEAVQSSNMQYRLLEHGVESELHIVEFWGHVNTFLFARKAVDGGIDFLKKKLN
ncbi:MAG: alpha/beta hydrolase [Proteobacteria bacterium]|nr:alpha/beta hydrolase [Pseudomonadota bacterium]